MGYYRSEADIREYAYNMVGEWLDDATMEDVDSGLADMAGEIRGRIYCKDMLTKEQAMWLKEIAEHKFNHTVRVLAKKNGTINIGLACILSMYDDMYHLLCRPGTYEVPVR